MKKTVFICMMLPALMQAQNLKEILEIAVEKNNIIGAKKFTEASKRSDIKSVENSYYPTIDIGSGYQSVNKKNPQTPGDIYNASLKLGVDLYDGGLKESKIEKNRALLEAAKYDSKAYMKSLELSITEDFYDIKNTQSNLRALREKNHQLEAELTRIQQFYEVGSATKDEVDKLQAALQNNTYQIQTLKFQLLSLQKLLSVKVGEEIKSFDTSHMLPPAGEQKELSDEIKVMMANANSYDYVAQGLESAYNPQIRLENTYSMYEYGRTDRLHPEGLDSQNKFLLSFSMRLFDNGVKEEEKKSILLQKKALKQQIEQARNEQNVSLDIAKSQIKTAKSQIQSAKSSLESAASAYEMILQKYKAGVLDNIAYLDALTTRTNAKAQYEKALNDLEVAYANYYYHQNKRIKDFIQ